MKEKILFRLKKQAEQTDFWVSRTEPTSNAPDRSEVGPIIEEARGWMRLMRECSISQVKRDGNGVANALALYARRGSFDLLKP